MYRKYMVVFLLMKWNEFIFCKKTTKEHFDRSKNIKIIYRWGPNGLLWKKKEGLGIGNGSLIISQYSRNFKCNLNTNVVWKFNVVQYGTSDNLINISMNVSVTVYIMSTCKFLDRISHYDSVTQSAG